VNDDASSCMLALQKKAGAELRFLRHVIYFLGSSVLLTSTQTAHAQTSVYGTVATTNFCLNSSSYTNCKSDTLGFLGGGFYNFPIQSRLTAGIDGRVSYGLGTRGGESATAALRIGFVPTRNPLRPYFQLGGGVVSSAGGDPLQGTRHTSGAVQSAFGLDIRLTPSIDLRALELGGAAGGGSASNPSAGTAYLDGGVVYHFRPH
jgi:hypothetical protein